MIRCGRMVALVLLPLFLSVGCRADDDAPTGPSRTRHVGVVSTVAEEAFTAPDTARAGARITLSVTTLGDGECTTPAGATVEVPPPDPMSPFVSPPTLLITPYDYQLTTACTRDRVLYPREVRVTAPSTAGRLYLIIRGQGQSGTASTVEHRHSIVIVAS